MVSKLKITRIQSELTQVKLADRAGMYQSRLSEIERGRRPDRDEAERIAKALGVRPEDLFDGVRK